MKLRDWCKRWDRGLSSPARRLQIALFIGLAVAFAAPLLGFAGECREIRENVLRLHILANSDSADDQALKLKVRDRLLTESDDLFAGARTEREAADRARRALPRLQSLAESVVAEEGYDYSVEVSVGPADFGTREYDDFTLPAGRYEAVRVVIGNGEGQNWWCVMFPALCLPAAAEDATPESVFNRRQSDIVQNAPKYEFRFKTLEIIEDLKNSFSRKKG